MSDARIFWSVFVRDPYLFLGLVTLGVPAVAGYRVYASVREVGFRYTGGFALLVPAFWWEAHFKEYARGRSKYGWPVWPLYAAWIPLLIGVPLLVVGILRL